MINASHQGWRASVKSAHFVLALRDYYQDSARASASLRTSSSQQITSEAIVRPSPHRQESILLSTTRTLSLDPEATNGIPRATIDPSDDWTLQYIRVDRLRYIQDAIDTDASGFITVNEVNKFTQTRPSDWRYAIALLRFVALAHN